MDIPIKYEASQCKLIRIRADWAGNFNCYWLDTTPLEMRARYDDEDIDVIDDFRHLDDDRINAGVSDGRRFDNPPF